MINRNLVGIVGELGVCTCLDRLSRKHNLRYIHNMPLKTATAYQQIDVILLSEYGFFSLEVKNWNGIVTCGQKDYYWTVHYQNRDIPVRSPYSQNQSHIRLLGHMCSAQFDNLIVFPDTCVLLDKMSSTIHLSELSNIFDNRQKCRSQAYIDQVYDKLIAEKRIGESDMIADLIMMRLEEEKR